MKKVLVTGGCGFIGGHLVDFLIEKNYSVTVVDDNSNGHYKNPKATYLVKDVNNIDLSDIENIDIVYHLAGILDVQASLTNPNKYYESNSTVVYKLLEKCIKQKIKKFVYASSCACAYPDSSPYASSKYIPELYCKDYSKLFDIDTASLRFFNVYGERMSHSGYKLVLSIFLDQYKNNVPLTITGTGKQTRDFVHVNDVVSALYKCKDVKLNGQVLNIGSGNHHSILDIAKMFNTSYEFIEERDEPVIDPVDLSYTKKVLNWSPVETINEFISCQIS